jgi:CHRD domain
MKRLVFASFLAGALLVAVAATAAVAHNDNGRSKAKLDGYQEAPLTLSTAGTGTFRIKLRSDGLHYTLRYRGVTTDVTQAHIHLGARGLAGGVIAFLCGGAPPASDKPACPLREGTVEGVIDMSDVIGPANQGIAAGEFREVVLALRKGVVYANVHTTQYPGGEIRGQINDKGHRNGDDRDRKRD